MNNHEIAESFYKKLQRDFPLLWNVKKAKENNWNPDFYVPFRWNDIIYNCSKELEDIFIKNIPNTENIPYVTQVKEKFGDLRFYVSLPPAELDNIIQKTILKAENLAEKICVVCGSKNGKKLLYYPGFPEKGDILNRVIVPSPYYSKCKTCLYKAGIEHLAHSSNKHARLWYSNSLIYRN